MQESPSSSRPTPALIETEAVETPSRLLRAGAIGMNMRCTTWHRIFRDEAQAVLQQAYGLTPYELPVEPTEASLLGSLHNCEVMITGWGALPLTTAVLKKCPALKLVIHGAGSIKEIVTDAARERGIRFCNAAHVNARPVAEFCLGIILCDLKRVLRFRKVFAETQNLGEAWWGVHRKFDGGYHRKKIGLIHWGRTARALAARLRDFDFEVFVDSEYVTPEELTQYKLQPAEADWIMAHCDVVSLHAAEIPKTRHLINARNLALMKDGASLINTARGGLIDEDALVAELRKGRIWAFLDIAQREPPLRGHPFYSLENCVLTPHVSGSIGTESFRLGDYVLREIGNHFCGKALENPVNLAELDERA